jgi:hypothetical protein
MNRKELLVISVGVFLTIVAWLIIDIYQIKRQPIKEKSIVPLNLTEFGQTNKYIDILQTKKP